MLAWIFAIAAITLVCGAAAGTHPGTEQAVPTANIAKITIDYPLNESVFPPDITAPTLLWHDPSQTATAWVIDISFAGHATPIRIEVPGRRLQIGETDPDAGPRPELTPEQAATHTWQPDMETWTTIKKLSVNAPATIAISGIAGEAAKAVSSGTVTISTSTDPVGAPIFYRNVPLRSSAPPEDAPIAPLPQSSIPLIKWEVRNVSEPESHVVMEKLPTCANCHSFSRDGKTFGLDMDGPRNDKGLYALVPVEP